MTNYNEVTQHLEKEFNNAESATIEPENYQPLAGVESLPPQQQIPIPQKIIGSRKKPTFPLDDLPLLMREAVIEVQAYVQAPIPLAVSSLLSIVSIISQGLYVVQRDSALTSPLSLYVLTVAEPNERKSAIEGYFRPVIDKWLMSTLKAYEEKHQTYEAEKVAHEILKGVIEKDMKQSGSDEEELKKLTNKLSDLIANEPVKPLSPRMLFGDATKEAIAKSLDENYPTAGIISAEAGGILAGALTRDGLTGVLAMLNSLWSGETVTINRSGDGDRVLKNTALTLGLSVQGAVMNEFLNKGKDMARGIGFLARTLFCYPESTQGQRFYKLPPENNQAVELLNNHLLQLITMQEDHIKEGRLKRGVLVLSEEAKAAWVTYYNNTEKLQCRGKVLEYIRDVAGKTADNAARIAGLFHLIESVDPISNVINADCMEMGCKVAGFYLEEALVYLEASELPEEFKNAQETSERLIGYMTKRKVDITKGKPSYKDAGAVENSLKWSEITYRRLIRIASTKVRDKKLMTSVIVELEDADHIIGSYTIGKSIIYKLNPYLMEGGE